MDQSISMDEILKSMGPAKSGKAYDRVWQDLLDFTRISSPKELKEAHFMRFFFHLKKTGLKASSLWTKYSMLNNVYKRETGHKLQDFPRLTLQLKSYNQGYVRKAAKTFSLLEFQAFMRMELDGPFWLVRKAFAAIAWCGGMRCDELHRLCIQDLQECPEGIKVNFTHSKQWAEAKENTILVPFNKSDPSICLASKVKVYLDALGPLADDKTGKLFKGTMKGKRFVKNPMGHNLLHNIGKDVARILSLDNPDTYTGHCWRRSSATQIAGQGASTLDMKRQFGWKQDTTAMKYIDATNYQCMKMASLSTGQSMQGLPTDRTTQGLATGAINNAQSLPTGQMGTNVQLENTETATHVFNITMGNHCSLYLGKN